jgi:two-component system chemotaxis response regulator CheY
MSKRVLMVDDSKVTRSMVAFALRRAGYTVTEAEDGQHALTVLEGTQVDCIITDINMPVMDGLALIRRLRASPAHARTPIVMLTTATEAAKKQEGQVAGATEWIGKPFHPATLVEIVGRFA